MTAADQAGSAGAPRDGDAALPPDCQAGLARLMKLIRARLGKFQLLILDCRDETLRARLIADIDALLHADGRRTAQLRLKAQDYPDFAAVERDLTALAESNTAIHIIGGASWFDAAKWEEFNIRREAVAREIRASLLLWLNPESTAELARIAIDLWAWRAAVVTFETKPPQLRIPEPDFRVVDGRTRTERTARIEFLRQVFLEPNMPDDMRVELALEMGNLAVGIGNYADAEQAYRNAARVTTDERLRAIAKAGIADILQARGQFDEALRIRRDEVLPVFDRLGDARERAMTIGKIADILQARGNLDEVLRIRRDEILPVFDRLGDVRSRAVAMNKIADILQAQGELDEAQRIRREEVLPVFERLGDLRERAITMGRIADILQARGELDEALRIRREEELPVFDHLGAARERAVTIGKIADILRAFGQFDEALRIWREEVLPVFDRLGNPRLRFETLYKIASSLIILGGLNDARASEIYDTASEALSIARRLDLAAGIAHSGVLLADVLAKTGRGEEALPVLDEAEAAFAKLGDAEGLARAKALRETLTAPTH